jgi:hypothetical protein
MQVITEYSDGAFEASEPRPLKGDPAKAVKDYLLSLKLIEEPKQVVAQAPPPK